MVNRSALLMKFASRLLFQRCRNVLVTDLGWPPYRAILDQEATRTSRRVTALPIRGPISRADASEAEIVSTIRNEFCRTDCDGLFLTGVSHLGIRLPVEAIVRSLEAARELRFVVIDGAQDFCHASAGLKTEYCDLYLAGCHKWLQGFHPMGLGFYGRNRSRGIIETLLNQMIEAGELDDPLLRFTNQLETKTLDGETETVNLIPLFTCQGAAADAIDRSLSLADSLDIRRANLDSVAETAFTRGWRPLIPAEPFRTGIMLLQASGSEARSLGSAAMRNAFADRGVAITAYDEGIIRLSMPSIAWSSADTDTLDSALRSIG
jgi:hypothetical protein